MRKYIRELIKAEARRKGASPSYYIHCAWQKLQYKRYGHNRYWNMLHRILRNHRRRKLARRRNRR